MESKEYVGSRFGRVLVLEELPVHITPNGSRQRIFKCKCDCGNVFDIRLSNLKKIKECGKCSLKSKRNNLIGKKFGRLTVIDYAPDYVSPSGNRLVRWKCKCDCGNEKDVISSDLTSGKTLSCGCLQKDVALTKNTIDLVGKRFGNLLVLKRIENHITSGGNVHHKYLCRCDCGNEIEVQGNLLRNGNVKSCGCMTKEYIRKAKQLDLIGKRFGRLVVIDKAEDYFSPNGERRSQWLCKCDCGNECLATGHSLVQKLRTSCGCDSTSHFELLVINFFNDFNYRIDYDYKRYITFDNLTGLGGKCLSYDFGIIENGVLTTLIECQGQQHYKHIAKFGSKERYETQIKHDEMKRKYALDNGYKLIEIPYTINSPKRMEDFMVSHGFAKKINELSESEKIKSTKVHIGESYMMNCGMRATLLAYRRSNDIDVVFDDGTIVESKDLYSFRKGKIQNPKLKKAHRLKPKK